MAATKTKKRAKVISKRLLLKMLKKLGACRGAQDEINRIGVREFFRANREWGGHISWFASAIGSRPCPCTEHEPNATKAFRNLNRAALAYCRKHRIR